MTSRKYYSPKKAKKLEPRPREKPCTNLIETLIESTSKSVMKKKVEKMAILITKVTSKIYKPKSYNKVVKDLIHSWH